jgi:hypothetical protein
MSSAREWFGTPPAHAAILEIGPSYNPWFPKAQWLRARSVDHATAAELRAKYAGQTGVDVGRIEEVDFVWRDGALHDCIPPEWRGGFEIAAASHVLEHIPDPIGFLRSLEMLTIPHGRVFLALPDRRFCFDCFRSSSSTGEVLEAHHAGRRRHGVATLFDQKALTVSMDGHVCWGQTRWGEVRFQHDPEELFEFLRPPPAEGPYRDAHAWRFTPASFRLLMLDLAWLGLTDWRILRIGETSGCEFPVELGRGGREEARGFAKADLQGLRLSLLKARLREEEALIRWALGPA